MATENISDSRIRLGMVGGGEDSFIGAVHRVAARLDDHFDLVAGALSSTSERAQRSGRMMRLPEDRIYPDHAGMARLEAARADGIEAVTIATPNHLHHEHCAAFLDAGIHVICDKPLACSMAEARDLAARAKSADLVFTVTYNNTGYPMVREARDIVASGRIGEPRAVQIEYAQDWLTNPIDAEGHKQAAWRTDPARVGPGACIGDVGTHAFNLAAFVSGLELESVFADVSSFVAGRRMDDDANILLRYGGGARGSMWASQIACGNENGLRVRVYGASGGVEWDGETPNHLKVIEYGAPPAILTRGGFGVGSAANRITRMAAGLPEGYLECFANTYLDAAELIRAKQQGRAPDPAALDAPDISDGMAAVGFVEAVVESAGKDRWVDVRR
ncbi:MAG: Gfo/Idh/MocA family oxidoreductase [Rhodospirillales bacterium]|jgi:predicted dehydrogenase|nr:Gfo/Idh/MocA family oxidoreductase [Rhodospirillales bacterium]